MPPVGFAVVGLGALATTAILPAFRGMQRAKLVALVSRDIEKARRLASEHDVPSAYDSLDKCLTNHQVEAVYVATPPGEHLREEEYAALANRHVLCEKPLAVTAAEAAEMVAICARQSVLLMTAYRKCFEPSTVFIRNLILSQWAGGPGKHLLQRRLQLHALSRGNVRFGLALPCVPLRTRAGPERPRRR